MADNSLKNKYFVRKGDNDNWDDFATKWDGLRVLSVTGFLERGKPLNIYTAKWLTGNTQREDFMITNTQTVGGVEVPYVIRENVDLEITFIISRRYAVNAIDEGEVHDSFINFMTGSDIQVKSLYTNKRVRCVCMSEYKPTTVKLHRGVSSYILGTIKLHTLDEPVDASTVVVGDLYLGFGGATLSGVSDITGLSNVQHYNKVNAAGEYTITCGATSYLWICTKGTISGVEANGFEVPMESYISVGGFRCYRSSNAILPHTMTFEVITQ